MTVEELIKELESMPQNVLVYAEGELADSVVMENCQGNIYVRIFKSWDTDFVLGSAGLKGDKDEQTTTEALEQISHLKGRPCEVCEYHTENGCSEWECVFKGV